MLSPGRPVAHRMFEGGRAANRKGRAAVKTYCGNLLWQSSLSLLAPRRLYNERLPKFRVASLTTMRGAIMNGYENRTAEEREAIWDEFCRRAKATSEERKKAEE